MSGILIGKIIVSPNQPKCGESVRVEVFDVAEQSLEGKANIMVTLNGVEGALQYLQFSTPREYTIIAHARKGRIYDKATVKFTVVGRSITFKVTNSASEKKQIPIMRMTQSRNNPYSATFTLGNAFKHGALSTQDSIVKNILSENNPTNANSILNRDPKGKLEKKLAEIAENHKSLTGHSIVRVIEGRSFEAKIYDVNSTDIDRILRKIKPSITTRYEWDFGDGTKSVTTSPFVEHDFFHQMQHRFIPDRFHVRCKVVHSDIEVVRTVNIYSAYSLCKVRGIIVPHVTADCYAKAEGIFRSASLTIYNIEDQSIVISQQAIVPLADDSSEPAVATKWVALKNPITLPAKSSSIISVLASYDLPGFSVYFAGKTADGTPVRASAIFEVPLNERDDRGKPPPPVVWTEIWPPWDDMLRRMKDLLVMTEHPENEALPNAVSIDRATGTLATTWNGVRPITRKLGVRIALDRIFAIRQSALSSAHLGSTAIHSRRVSPTALRIAVGLSKDPLSLRAVEVMDRRVFAYATATKKHVMSLDDLPIHGPIIEGEICYPDNLTEADLQKADADQLACQLTEETVRVKMPCRFMNARKGDIILSPGGDGLIGTLLRCVEPPQKYSHTGIMTRNYDEVTHSTACEKVLEEYIANENPTNGLPKNMLKYMWPGVVTQSVEGAVNGEKYPHPEGGDYSICSFSAHAIGVTHNNFFEIVPPMVIKPDPLKETLSTRTTLHEVADMARSSGARRGETSKSHYRLYCYTDPTIGQSTLAPASAGWASGTFPSVCSSFIWMTLKKKGVKLEAPTNLVMPADLEPLDVANGAFVNPFTKDGLYTYTASERLAAAQWLHDTIYYQGYDAANWYGEILTDAASDIANQITNTFANDNATGQDSDAWKEVKEAHAVSPDNILWWDSLDNNGLYGYAEPLIYRERRWEEFTLSKWKRVVTRGTITGTVRFNGAAVAGAHVQCAGKEDLTDSSGKFELTNVYFGNYNLQASKPIDNRFCYACSPISLQTESKVVDLTLQPPANDFRLADIIFDFWGEDDEWVVKNQVTDPGLEMRQLELGPDMPSNSFFREYKWGGELRVEYNFRLTLLVGNIINVLVQARLYDDTSESGKDLNGTGTMEFQVPMDETNAGTLRVWNTAEDVEADQGILAITVKNGQNNN